MADKELFRAGVAAGILDEATAARMIALAESRSGQRAHMHREDEPFELFRGFSDLFIILGLAILFSGILGLFVVFDAQISWSVIAGGAAGLAWLFAEYLTRKRRLSGPSVFLTFIFALTAGAVMSDQTGMIDMITLSAFIPPAPAFLFAKLAETAAVTLGALILWHWRFRVPFTMLMAGIAGFAVVIGLVGMVRPIDPDAIIGMEDSFFNLAAPDYGAEAILLFALLAFAAAMWFDFSDPHRISRRNRAAFWLHLLAAPALVNVVAMSLIRSGLDSAHALTAVWLALMTLLALVIDRRSFLTAGLGYMSFLLGRTFYDSEDSPNILTLLLVLGGAITLLGVFWMEIRAAVMRSLPNFPAKHRLPPYATPQAMSQTMSMKNEDPRP